jgi:hypothetical protein
LETVAKGLHINHWTSRDLVRQAIADGIVETINPRTVRQILYHVDLQPHRTRYWKTARLDAKFNARAEKVLWWYGNAEILRASGEPRGGEVRRGCRLVLVHEADGEAESADGAAWT